jgi:hypothetical protein
MSAAVFPLYRVVEHSADPLTIPKPVVLLDDNGYDVDLPIDVDDAPPVLVSRVVRLSALVPKGL